jgi:hypothetical protein
MKLGLGACKAGTRPLEPLLQYILVWLFWRWDLRTVFPDWPHAIILPISDSQVARITGISHQHLVNNMFSFENRN